MLPEDGVGRGKKWVLTEDGVGRRIEEGVVQVWCRQGAYKRLANVSPGTSVVRHEKRVLSAMMLPWDEVR